MAIGYKTEGSGKKKGYKAPHTLEAAAAKQHIIQRVIAELDPMLDAQISIAKSKSNRGAVLAFKELMERGFGKTPTIVGNEDGKKFIVEITSAGAKKYDINPSAGNHTE